MTDDVKAFKHALRKEKIAAREALSEEDRLERSTKICERARATEEYEKANANVG